MAGPNLVIVQRLGAADDRVLDHPDSYALGYMIETDMSRFVAVEDLS